MEWCFGKCMGPCRRRCKKIGCRAVIRPACPQLLGWPCKGIFTLNALAFFFSKLQGCHGIHGRLHPHRLFKPCLGRSVFCWRRQCFNLALTYFYKAFKLLFQLYYFYMFFSIFLFFIALKKIWGTASRQISQAILCWVFLINTHLFKIITLHCFSTRFETLLEIWGGWLRKNMCMTKRFTRQTLANIRTGEEIDFLKATKISSINSQK